MAEEIVNPPVKFHGEIIYTPGELILADAVNAEIVAALTSQFGGTWDSELK